MHMATQETKSVLHSNAGAGRLILHANSNRKFWYWMQKEKLETLVPVQIVTQEAAALKPAILHANGDAENANTACKWQR